MAAPRSRRLPAHAVACAAYLAGALFAVRAVVPAPATRCLAPTFLPPPLVEACWIDQQFVTARIAEVADALTGGASALQGGQCHPLSRPYTLGEHMWAEGLLAALPYRLSGDPILAYNVTLVLSLWVAGVAMYLLVWHWTRSAAAAFVAGALFAFQPLRVGDPVHPFVHANHWIALALLFLHRLFAGGRWRDAAALAAVTGLQLLESFYTVLTLAIVGGIAALHLAVRCRHRLPALAPKLAACAVAVGLTAAAVFVPYLETRATWGVLGGRSTQLHALRDFGPRGRAFPGWVAGALAAVALIDRLRGPRRRNDPRWPLAVAGVAAGWMSMGRVALPGTGVAVPAPFEALRDIVPGLGAVRAAMNVGDGAQLVVATFAGFGAAALLAVAPRPARPALGAALAAVALWERFTPWVPRASGMPAPLSPYVARPPADLLGLVARLPDGAVLDVPYVPTKAHLRSRGHYLMLAAFHRRPTGACHNSFNNPLGREVNALVRRLPDVRAADALSALGFRTLLLHEESPADGTPVAPATIDALRRDGRLRLVGTAATHTAYAIESPLAVQTRFDVLVPAGDVAPTSVGPPRGVLRFTIRNPTPAIFRHPDPLEPVPCTVRWYTADGRLVETQQRPLLLPLALGAGDTAERLVRVDVAVPDGDYEVTLAPGPAPDAVIGRARVRVSRSHRRAPPG